MGALREILAGLFGSVLGIAFMVCSTLGCGQVEFEALPELVADMDRTGLAMALGGDPRRIDLDQCTAAAP
jgi:predicted phage tail protein